MKKRSGAKCPTPPDYLEPIVACWSSNNLVAIASVVWLFFNVVGQPKEQLKHLACLHLSEFEWINSGEEVAELNSERKHSLIEC